MSNTSSIKPSIYNFENDPYNYIMKIIGNRWNIFIIQGIATDGATRFSRFTKQLPISEKVLTTALKQLESDGIIERTVYPEVPARVEYSLTNTGNSILPILNAMYDWSWRRMTDLGMEIDPLGEMWRGYREIDSSAMQDPYKK